MSILKQEYNKALEYFYDAANKFDDPKIPNEIARKWQPRFKELLANLNRLIHEIEKEISREVTEDEILNGFKE
jgi:regulator of sirC expression with transglutaminase-like and TPR domain